MNAKNGDTNPDFILKGFFPKSVRKTKDPNQYQSQFEIRKYGFQVV